MKLTKYIIFLFFPLLFACKSRHEDQKDLSLNIYSPRYSSNFSIDSVPNSKNTLISVYNPWQGAKDVTSQLLIARDSIIPEGYNGEILKGDVNKIICMSSTHIAMLDILGDTDKIVGVSGKQYISNPKIIASSSMIPDIGYEGNIDYESLIASKPDLVLLFSVNGASGMQPKLKELGIPYLYVGDYVEENPLGKVEWIVPIAEILDKREEAVRYLEEVSGKYNNLKEKVNETGGSRPKVMVNAPFNDYWFMPSTESYVARMIKDAGGDYIYTKNTGNTSEPIDMEEALKLVNESDYWINIGTVKSLAELKSEFPLFVSTNCVKNGNVYNNNFISSPGGGNDCYESGAVRPELVLRDMIKIFHPELIEEDFTYYHQLK